MLLVLICFFIGQEPAIDAKANAAKMLEAGMEQGREIRNFRGAYLNAKIKLLSLVRKAKVHPSLGKEVNWRFDHKTKEGEFYVIQFSNPREKSDYEKQLKTEILEEKQAIAALGPFSFPRLSADYPLDFGVPLDDKIRVVFIIDATTCIIQLPAFSLSKDYLLTGMPTEGISDDSIIRLDVPLMRNGTAKAGLTTYAAYRLVTEEEAKALAELAKDVKIGEPIRAWESFDGKHSTRAKLVGFDLKTVKLQREDGEIVELAISKLSKQDQSYAQRVLGLEPLDLP